MAYSDAKELKKARLWFRILGRKKKSIIPVSPKDRRTGPIAMAVTSHLSLDVVPETGRGPEFPSFFS
jgi:hypothetical protein